MSLVQRKARPLTRDAVSLRDDRLFIVACDDTYAPKQYFGFFNITRVMVHVVPTQDGTSVAKYVLERLLNFAHEMKVEVDDELWMLLDIDHCTVGNHFKSFIAAIKDARRRNIKVALSKPCFELWLLLHHEEESAVTALKNAQETEIALRKKLGQYDKRNLKQEHYPLASVYKACQRAERLDGVVKGGDNPSDNISQVYLLWKAIAAKGLPSQLPAELRGLLP